MKEQKHERGFTIVELLVAMAVAGILISLIFAVYTRMSVAYQAQNRITAVVQNLRAGQDRLVRELRMAGDQIPQPDYQPLENGDGPIHFAPDNLPPLTANMHYVSGSTFVNGLKVASTVLLPGQPADRAGHPLQPIYITNGGGTEPDQIRFFYADQGTGAKVGGIVLDNVTVIDLVDHDTTDGISPASAFAQGDLVVLVNSTQEQILRDVDPGLPGVESFEMTAYESCLLRVTAVDTATHQLTFSEVASPFNEYLESNLSPLPKSHCDDVLTQHNADIARPAAPRTDTMIYKLFGRSYRIDTARRQVGVLQFHPDGELTGAAWQDLGINFTNLQIASRWFEGDDPSPDNKDGLEALLEYDWYSGESQEFPDLTTPAANRRADNAVMVGLTLSLETRTFAPVDTPTGQIDGYQQGGTAEYNPIGDSPGFTLVPPPADPRYNGRYLYRWSTISFELRNAGRAN